ncbi:MAG TPA: hypothetical protein VLJ41_08100 [Segetibacter sp.]|nr:hypothetical protein [Segetibacter sp.]
MTEKQLSMQPDDERFNSYKGAVLLKDEVQIKSAYCDKWQITEVVKK